MEPTNKVKGSTGPKCIRVRMKQKKMPATREGLLKEESLKASEKEAYMGLQWQGPSSWGVTVQLLNQDMVWDGLFQGAGVSEGLVLSASLLTGGRLSLSAQGQSVSCLMFTCSPARCDKMAST